MCEHDDKAVGVKPDPDASAPELGHDGLPPSKEAIDNLACALFKALCAGNPKGLVIGEPLEKVCYFEGELLDGVLVDGVFDLKRAASFLIDYLDKSSKLTG